MQTRNPTALLVEDDPDFRALARSALILNNYSCLEASTYEEGFSIALRTRPKLIVLDVSLPHGSGMTLLALLKAKPKTSTIPIFMLTSHTLIREMESAFDLGANEYIMKPISLYRLAKTMELGLARLPKQLSP